MKVSWRNEITDVKESAECPSVEEMGDMMVEDVWETPICHCMVEPDGICQHGRPSWLLAMGFVPRGRRPEDS